MYYVPSVLSPKQGKAVTSFCGIEFYWAKIGHGKTHHVVRERLLTALKEGRHVYTNISFGGPLMVADCEVFSEEQRAGMIISDYLKKDIRHLFHIVTGEWVRANISLGVNDVEFKVIPAGSRIILDEVQNIFPVGGYKSAPDGFFRFLCKCRHFDVDFVFISQNTSLVDKRIVSTASDFIKIKNAGFLSSFLSKGYRVTHHQSQYDFEGYNSESKVFDNDIFKLYLSSNSLISHQHRAIPKFLLVPVLGIFFWACLFAYKTHNSKLWGGESAGLQAPVLETSKTSKLPATPAVEQTTPAGNSMRPAAEVIKELLAMPTYRDSVISPSTTTAKWSYMPPKAYKPVLRHGVEYFGN